MKLGGWAQLRRAWPGRLFFLAGLCIAVCLFAPLYLLRFLSLFVLLVILGARFYSEYLIRRLRVIRRDREIRCFRFEWADIELTVENSGLLPAFMLALGDWPGDLAVFKDHKKLCTLPGRSRLVFTWRAYCSERGIGSLGPAQLRCADPLGIFPFAATAGENTRLVVYPAPGMIALTSPGGIPLGKLPSRSPLYEDMTRRRSLREYRRGDEPRRINWKASMKSPAAQKAPPRAADVRSNVNRDTAVPAKANQDVNLLVNEYEAAISCPLVVFLNLDPYEYSLGKRELWFERAIEAAAALCLMASRDRQDLGIIFYRTWEKETREEESREGETRQEGAEDPCTLIKPSPFTLLPILERLAAIKRPQGPGPAPDGGEETDGETDGKTEGGERLRGSTRSLLDQGKRLPYGTRLVYTGPELPGEDYIALNTLRASRLSLEYLVLDERRLGPTAPGNAPRYQMREGGYDII
ncbi:MAG: DUF58 domain-containing protein [Treponema sp.]|jgi:uncharacterized protein (DUF58 family)|nr:DUF58 domain-containing protein [Treponema sp.]